MKLVDLDPRWLMQDGRRIGFVFLSPQARPRSDGSPNSTPWRQTCFVVPTPSKVQRAVIAAAMGGDAEDAEDGMWTVQECNPACGWTIAGGIDAATFDGMTVTPSIDGSAGGLWHGFITNGDIR